MDMLENANLAFFVRSKIGVIRDNSLVHNIAMSLLWIVVWNIRCVNYYAMVYIEIDKWYLENMKQAGGKYFSDSR